MNREATKKTESVPCRSQKRALLGMNIRGLNLGSVGGAEETTVLVHPQAKKVISFASLLLWAEGRGGSRTPSDLRKEGNRGYPVVGLLRRRGGLGCLVIRRAVGAPTTNVYSIEKKNQKVWFAISEPERRVGPGSVCQKKEGHSVQADVDRSQKGRVQKKM